MVKFLLSTREFMKHTRVKLSRTKLLDVEFWMEKFFYDLTKTYNIITNNTKYEEIACLSSFPHTTSTLRPVFNELIKQGFHCKWVSKPIHDGGKLLYLNSDSPVPREIRSRTIWVPHGIGHEEPKPYHISCKRIFLTGEYFFDLYKEKPFGKDKLEVIGFPKLDILFSPDKELIKERVKKEFNLDLPYEKNILYTPSWIPTYFMFKPESISFNKSVFSIIEMSQDLKMNLIIKPHPFTIKSCNKTIYHAAQARAKKMKNVVWINKNIEDITPLYLFADVLISDHSSTLFEFMLTEKISIQLTNVCSKEKLYDGTTKSSLKGLHKTIIQTIYNPYEFLDNQRKIIRKRVFKPDGNASKRAVKIIEKLLS